MKQLPPAFAALAEYPQFVIWKAFPSAERAGKTDKVVVHPTTLTKHNPYDSAIQFTAADAITICNTLPDNCGVGFVFTEEDPFWFFDIDGCTTPEGEWTTEAVNWCTHFHGAAVEISHSGKGLHIIGTGSHSIGPHRKKHELLNLEFYTEARFVALTGNGASGDSGFDASHILPKFAADYFPAKSITGSAEWTDTAHPDSRPIKTDAALIKRMLGSVKAGHLFSDKVSVHDLWTANPEKLSAAWGSFNDNDDFDHSSADQSLCNHLAFWTGKDCERMQRLFEKSALVRDKWKDREQYRRDTILNACADTTEMYGSQKAAKEAAAVGWNPEKLITDEVKVTAKGGAEIVSFQDRVAYFNGHYFLTKHSKVFCPDGVLRNQTEYNAMYSVVEFAEQFEGKPVKEAWKAYIVAPDIKRAEVYDTAYRPEYQFGTTFEDGGRFYVNEYVNQDGITMEGDCSPFLDHLNLILPNGRDAEILLSWMAAFIQHPGVKFLWSPFLQGCEGNGKSLMTRVLAYCVGVDHIEDVDPEDFCNSGGKFNAYIKNHRLAVLEEIHTGPRNQAEAALKRMIGNSRIQVQAKGIDQTTVKTCINWLIYSNHKDAIRIDDNSRRFAILFTDQQEKSDLKKHGMQRGGHYFTELFDWFHKDDGWAKVANLLKTYAIPAELNPAGLADKAPETTSFLEAIQESKSAPHQAVVETLTSGRSGTLKGWVSVQALRMILHTDHGLKIPSGKMLASYLRAEGYIKHPALKNNGRVTRALVAEGNQRSVIYVKTDSIAALNLTEAQDVTDQYMRDQGYLGAPLDQTAQAMV